MTRTLGRRLFGPASALALVLSAGLAIGCEQGKSKLDPVMNAPTKNIAGSEGGGDGAGTQPLDIDSKEILARGETADTVQVKHVLIGWKDLAATYRGQMDPRAKERSNADAAKLAQDIAAQLQADPGQIDALVKQHSEDPGSQSGEPYEVTPQAGMVPEFKELALRLRIHEVGIVKTMFGYHVMVRVPPPPPDPLESADILARTTPETGKIHVQHVLIGWKGAPAARGATRTKEEADQLAKEVLEKVRAGGDMAALMKQYSEDPGSKDNARIYDVSPDAPLVEPFKKLSLRLAVDEAGLVKSPFGWHVIKRVPPPPPDALESAAILAREPVTKTAKVKHILLGWSEANGGDPRAQTRDRATLEKLVKGTVGKLQKGAKIEPLMKELSEDPGSAQSGSAYDVTPDGGFVQPFTDLSLRLEVGEVGAVKTTFGIHIIQRIE